MVYSRPPLTGIEPLTMVSFDATSPPNEPAGKGACQVEYDVPALLPGEVHTTETYFEVQV